VERTAKRSTDMDKLGLGHQGPARKASSRGGDILKVKLRKSPASPEPLKSPRGGREDVSRDGRKVESKFPL